MVEDDLWLSEDEDGSDHELELSTDPARFNMSLTPQEGQSGGYHVRNRDGEIQRAAVSAFHGGFRKKPAFTVNCEAKAMIHGRMDPSSGKKATLLVYEFKFLSRRGTRIKSANILFEFRARATAPGAANPSVAQVRPNGQMKMGETIENQATKYGLSSTLGPSIPGFEAGVTASGERNVTKDIKYHTIVTGDNPADMEWGDHYQATFSLEENESQKSGIPTLLTVVILLERQNDDDFEMIPRIEVKPNFSTMVGSLASSRSPDDPVNFSAREPAFNRLDKRTEIDANNLAATDLDSLWICNMYTLYLADVEKLNR